MASPAPAQFYCHECSYTTSRPLQTPELTCPNCNSSFLEELTDLQDPRRDTGSFQIPNEVFNAADDSPEINTGMGNPFAFLFGNQAPPNTNQPQQQAQPQAPNSPGTPGGGVPVNAFLQALMGMASPPPNANANSNDGNPQGNPPPRNAGQIHINQNSNPAQNRPPGMGAFGSGSVSFTVTDGHTTNTRTHRWGSENDLQETRASADAQSPPPPRPNSQPMGNQSGSQIPIRSLGTFLQQAFGAAQATPSPPASPSQPANVENSPESPAGQAGPTNLAQFLFNMISPMTQQDQTPQTAANQENPAPRNGPRMQFFFGNAMGPSMVQFGFGPGFATNLGQAQGPGQFGDFVLTQQGLDDVITRLMEQAGAAEGPRRAPEEMINALPRRKLTAENIAEFGINECAVCKDEFNVDDEAINLPCKHTFHPDCIVPWLERSGTCPVCRHQLVEQPSHHDAAQGGNRPAAAPQPPQMRRAPTDVEMEPLD